MLPNKHLRAICPSDQSNVVDELAMGATIRSCLAASNSHTPKFPDEKSTAIRALSAPPAVGLRSSAALAGGAKCMRRTTP